MPWAQAAVQAHTAALLPAQVGGPSRPPGVVFPFGDPKRPTELEGTVLGNELAGGRAWLVFFHGLPWPFVLPAQSFRDGEAVPIFRGRSGH